MFPSEEVHTGICDSGIFLLPLPERKEKIENRESDVSSAEGLDLRTACARDGGIGFHIRYKFCSLEWFVLGVYKSIISFEEYHDTGRDEGEPRPIWLKESLVWECVPRYLTSRKAYRRCEPGYDHINVELTFHETNMCIKDTH